MIHPDKIPLRTDTYIFSPKHESKKITHEKRNAPNVFVILTFSLQPIIPGNLKIKIDLLAILLVIHVLYFR